MLTIKQTPNPIAILDEGRNKRTLIYYDDKEPKFTSQLRQLIDKQLTTEKGGFFPLPTSIADRDCIYIVGKSGSGKSHFAAEYVKNYHMMYPKNAVFLLSNKDKDPVFDVLKFITRIPVKKVMDDEIILSEFENSIVIFDDVDSFSDKLIEKEILKLQNDIYMLGRSTHVSLLHLKHIARDRSKSQVALQEMTGVVVFPGKSNPWSIKKLLSEYVDMSKEDIDAILRLKSSSRWAYISVSHPSFVVSEKKISLL